jgi:hypothetical protein
MVALQQSTGLTIYLKSKQAYFYRALRRNSNSEPRQLAIKIQDKAKILKAGAEEQIKNEVNIQVS